MLLVLSPLVLARLARAHTAGISTATFEVQGDGSVEAHLLFSTAEPLRGTPLNPQDLEAFVRDGVDVEADGNRCLTSFRGARVTEVDGLALDASYACSKDADEIEVTLYYLSDLAPGHREIARIVAGSATSEAVLSRDRRAIALRLPAHPHGTAHLRKGRLLAIVTAVSVALLSSMALWQGARALRKRKE
jgi:hypothetical protein